MKMVGVRGGAVGWGTALKPEGSIPDAVIFHWLWPWGRLSL
jgi:hypothetical protein